MSDNTGPEQNAVDLLLKMIIARFELRQEKKTAQVGASSGASYKFAEEEDLCYRCITVGTRNLSLWDNQQRWYWPYGIVKFDTPSVP